MVAFNLLPWREHESIYQQKSLKRMIAMMLFVNIIFLGVTHVSVTRHHQRLSSDLNLLRREFSHYEQLRLKRERNTTYSVSSSAKRIKAYQQLTAELFTELQNAPDE